MTRNPIIWMVLCSLLFFLSAQTSCANSGNGGKNKDPFAHIHWEAKEFEDTLKDLGLKMNSVSVLPAEVVQGKEELERIKILLVFDKDVDYPTHRIKSELGGSRMTIDYRHGFSNNLGNLTSTGKGRLDEPKGDVEWLKKIRWNAAVYAAMVFLWVLGVAGLASATWVAGITAFRIHQGRWYFGFHSAPE